MKTLKNWGLKVAVLAALVPVGALPAAANAALQYTPPQAMVLTCNGTAPNVLGKTSVLATFACANGQAPQAVGITSGMGGLLGLASGAAALVASEAVPSMALPAMGGGSGAGSNGSGSGAQSHGNGSSAGKGNGSNGSGNGNGNGSSANGSNGNAGPSASSGGGGGGWLGHLIHSVGQAAQQIGTAVVTRVASGTGGQATIPLFGGSGGQGTVAGGNNTGSLAGGSPLQGAPLTGGQPSATGINAGPVSVVYPNGVKVTTVYQRNGANALPWLQQNDPQGQYPVRLLQDVRAARGGGSNTAGYHMVSGTVAFCESTRSDGGGEEAMSCRVRSDGSLYVRVAGGISTSHEVPDGYGKLGPEVIDSTGFTVPRGSYQQAFTNLGGNDPRFYRSESTRSFEVTQGFLFPTKYLKAIPHMVARIATSSSCPAGVVVHARNGVPIVYQQETSGNMPFGWIPLGSGKNIYADVQAGQNAQAGRQQSRVEACAEVADVPSTSADLPVSSVLLGVRDAVEVDRAGEWLTDPAYLYLAASGTSPSGTPAYPLTYTGMPRQYAPWADLTAAQAVQDLHTRGFGNVSVLAGRYEPD